MDENSKKIKNLNLLYFRKKTFNLPLKGNRLYVLDLKFYFDLFLVSECELSSKRTGRIRTINVQKLAEIKII